MRDNGLRPLKRRSVPTHHHRELSVLRASLAARYRRVQEFEAALSCFDCELAGDFRRGRSVVDENGAPGHLLEGPVRSHGYFPKIRVVADAGKRDLRPLDGLCRGLGETPLVFGDPRLCLGAAAVIYGHGVPATGDEVSGHSESHYAKTDEREFAHCSSSHEMSRQESEIHR